MTPPWRFKACFDIRMVPCQNPPMPSPTHVSRSNRCLHMSIGCPRREVRDTSRVTLPIRTRESAITVGGSLVAPPWCNSHRNGSISEGFVTAVRVVDYLLLRQRLQTIEPLLQQHVPSVETFVTDAPYPLDSTRGKGRADPGHHR